MSAERGFGAWGRQPGWGVRKTCKHTQQREYQWDSLNKRYLLVCSRCRAILIGQPPTIRPVGLVS